MSIKILGSRWYVLKTGECIGIVTTETEIGEVKEYIGRGAGFDMHADELAIAANGVPFYR